MLTLQPYDDQDPSLGHDPWTPNITKAHPSPIPTMTKAHPYATLHDPTTLPHLMPERDVPSIDAPLNAPLHTPESPSSEFDIEDPPPPQKTHTLLAALYIFLWYSFSIILSVYNKWMFSPKGLNFRFPVSTTALHQLVQMCLAYATLRIFKLHYNHYSARDLLHKILPCALASSGDIGMGNVSLMYVTLSFYTMVKSSSLGFVLLFAVLFKLETLHWMLALIIGVLTAGVFMMVAGETQFHLLGFFLVLSASCASGLRWALTKVFLQGGQNKTRAKPHPVQTILLFTPFMFAILLVWGLGMEGPVKFVTADLWHQHSLPVALFLILVPGIFAYGLTLSEFALLNITGPLTLSIAGICKEVATIIVSVIVFGDELTLVNGMGLVVTISGIVAYHRFRASSERE